MTEAFLSIVPRLLDHFFAQKIFLEGVALSGVKR